MSGARNVIIPLGALNGAIFNININKRDKPKGITSLIRNSGGNKTMLVFWGYMKAAGKIKLKGYKNGKTSYM